MTIERRNSASRGAANNRRRAAIHFGLIIVSVIISILFYGAIPHGEETLDHWDFHKYIHMAKAAPGLANHVERPFIHRPLGPWLAGILAEYSGLTLLEAFRVLNTICALLTVIALNWFWLSCGLSGSTAMFLVLMFVANRTIYGFLVWDYFQINDWIGLMAIIVGLWAISKKYWSRLMMVIVVGVLAREAILLLLPVAAGYLYDQGRLRKEWRKLLMVAIPALVVFLVLRLVLPGEGNFRIWRAPFWFYPKWFRLQTWFGLFINAFAPLIWLFIVYRRATLRFILAEKHMVLLVGLVYASTLLAHDTERLLAPAAPVIYLLVGRILQAHNQKASLWLAGMLLSLALVTAIRHLFPRTEFVQAPLLDLGLVVLPTILAVYCGIVWQRKLDFPRFTRHFLGYN